MRPAYWISLVAKFLGAGLWWASPWIGAAVFFGPDLYLLSQMLAPSAQGLGRVFTRFATERREVWLTLDDGPDEADTPRILDLLDRHGGRAAFFVIGRKAARHPELVAEILRRGHTVGHHTQTHPLFSFWCASPARVGRELDEGLSSLARAGARPRWFRPPVGIKNFFLAGALEKRGLACVTWTIRSGDCVVRNPDRIVERVMGKVRPGAIILMHEGPNVPSAVRVEAIRGLLEALAARGFACVIPDESQLR